MPRLFNHEGEKLKYSKAVQLSTVLALSAVVSGLGSGVSSMRAATARVQPLQGRVQQLAQQPSSAEETYEQDRQAYFDSEYSLFDARLLADFWGESLDDTKARMGQKLRGTDEDIAALKNALAEADSSTEPAGEPAQLLSPAETHRQDLDAFFASDFSLDDAIQLSAFWGESLSDAKAHMGRTLRHSGEDAELLITDLLADIPADVESRSPEEQTTQEQTTQDDAFQQNRAMFFESDYSYEDADLLADFWGVSIDASKARIGAMLGGTGGMENIAVIDDYLRQAQEVTDVDSAEQE